MSSIPSGAIHGLAPGIQSSRRRLWTATAAPFCVHQCPGASTNVPCTSAPSVVTHAAIQGLQESSGVRGPEDSTGPNAPQWWTPAQLSPYIGPVSLRIEEGKGRAVVATQHLPAGTLLMCVQPVAILNTPPEHARPSADELVDLIVDRRYWQRAWFQALYDGTATSCTTCPDLSLPADAPGEPELPSMTPAAAPAGPATGFAAPKKTQTTRKSKVKRGAAAKTSPDQAPALEGAGLNKKTLRRIALATKYNCYGDHHEDLALCDLRGEKPRGHIGVWGPFAMFNHSCAPNAINYCVGDCMVVRAAVPISAGEEIHISYLGRPQLSPVGARRVQLQEDYGFQCVCARCTSELQHIDKLDTEQYEELHVGAAGRVREQYNQAIQEGDTEELRELYFTLQGALNDLSTQFRRAMVAPKARQYILASLYEVFELQMEICESLGMAEERAHLMTQVLRFLEVATPGSDLHVITASHLYAAHVAQHGPESAAACTTWVAVRSAHEARYGPGLDEATLVRLAHLNDTLYK